MRVFLDANILFSASAKQSATRQLLDRLLVHTEVLINAHVLEEARRSLLKKRPEQVHELRGLQSHMTMTGAFASDHLVDLPEEDVPVLAAAVGARCTHLWTSDKRHFGQFYGKLIRGVKVVSSIMLLEELMELG